MRQWNRRPYDTGIQDTPFVKAVTAAMKNGTRFTNYAPHGWVEGTIVYNKGEAPMVILLDGSTKALEMEGAGG